MYFPIGLLNQFFKDYPQEKGILSIWGDFGVGKTVLVLETIRETLLNNDDYGLFLFTKNFIPSSFFRKILSLSQHSLENIIQKLISINLLSFSELFNVIFNLELVLKSFLEKNTKISYLIIDSMTNLYNIDLSRSGKKNYLLNFKLNMILSHLTYLTHQYSISVLITNEVTFKNVNGKTHQIQSGGNVMDFWTPFRIKISRTKKLGIRKFLLENRITEEKRELKIFLSQNGFIRLPE